MKVSRLFSVMPVRITWGPPTVLVAGLLATAGIVWRARNVELESFRLRFEREASARAELVVQKLDECRLSVEALARFREAAEGLDRRRFTAFTTPFLAERKELQAIEWIPRVPRADLARYEERGRSEGMAGFRIHERTHEGLTIPVAERNAYYPVFYVEPMKGNEAAVGYDLGSNPARLAALERARDEGKSAVTERIRLVQEMETQSGFLLFHPVFRTGSPTATVEQRRVALEGFALGVFRAGDALMAVLGPEVQADFSIELSDLRASSVQGLFHRWEARSSGKATPFRRLLPPPPAYHRKFAFADREWCVSVRASSAFMARHYPLAYWLLAPTGLCASVGTAYIFALLAQRRQAQQRIEEALALNQKVERIFHLFLEHSPIYVFFKDEQIRSIYLSRNYEKMLGRPLAEILGRTMDEVFPSDLAKSMIQDDLRVMGERVPIEVEEELDGRHYHTVKFPVLEDGVPRYLAGFTQDITERRKAEAEVARLRASLAHVSSMSTLVEMAASIAHELNQPLAAIQANARAALRMIRNGNADLKELCDILEDISADDLRIGEIIRRMREPIHRGESAFHPLDLNDLIRELLGMVRNETFLAGTTLETDLEKDLPLVRGDRVQLLQVLLNLVNNAIDATRERESNLRRILISSARDSDSKVRVEVLDSGEGLTEGVLGRIFEPFFTTKPKGLGLGLAICKALTEAHGGTLSALNRQDGGARFSMVLPSQPHSGNVQESL